MTENTGSILFLGGGSMAADIIRGITADALVLPSQIHVIGRDPEHLQSLHRRYHVSVYNAAGPVMPDIRQPGCDDSIPDPPQCGTVILAVPPQALAEAVAANKKNIPKDALIISVCAGATIARLHALLDHSDTADAHRIIRVMPNTLGITGHGYSSLCPSETATAADTAFAQRLFSSLGEVLMIPEALFDAFTAFSCSSPAYVLQFAQGLIDAGMRAGFTEVTARDIVLENLIGTAEMLRITGDDPAHVVDRMSTPGGITEAAIHVLRTGSISDKMTRDMPAEGINDLLDSAITCGISRAKEL